MVIKKVIFAMACLVVSSGATAQTDANWHAIGMAGGSAGNSQYNLKALAGFIASGIGSDGVYLHWAGVRFSNSGALVSVENADDVMPWEFALNQNYPNPFNPSTRIEYSLAERSDVSLTVFNILGQKVTEIVHANQAAGEYSVDWQGRNNSGGEVASGVYFFRLVAGDFSNVRKMLLIK